MPAAVVALEAVPSFPPRIGQRDERDGGVVEGARRLFVEEVHLGHHCNGGHVPGGLVFLLAGDRLDRVAPFAFGFVGFDAGDVRGMIRDVHRSTTARFGASQMFVLECLNESTMALPFLV